MAPAQASIARLATTPAVAKLATRVALAGILLLSATLEVVLYRGGLYTVSADESERTLFADKLTLASAFKPSLWPPLPQIVTGLALKVDHDLLVVPRVVVGIAGLLTVAAMFRLARELFVSPLVAVSAALVAVFIPQRLMMSVVPLADGLAYLFVVSAAMFMVAWLNRRRPRDLVATSLCLLFASATRYEAWYLNATFLAYLTYRALVRRDVAPRLFAASATLLGAFPVAWIAATYARAGSLAPLHATGKQFVASHGHDLALDIHDNVIAVLVRDVVTQPILWAALAALVVLIRLRRDIRAYVLLFSVPLVLFAATMVVTYSVPTAAPWRTDGVWLLLAAPFAAWAIVQLAGSVSRSRIVHVGAALLLTVAAMIPSIMRADRFARQGREQTGALANDPLQSRLQSIFDAGHRRILLDAIGSLDYLNVLVASQHPDRFVLDVNADPTTVAMYSPERSYYIHHAKDRAIVRNYLTDKFDLAEGADAARLRRLRIGYLLVQSPKFIRALERSPRVLTGRRYGRWMLFSLA